MARSKSNAANGLSVVPAASLFLSMVELNITILGDVVRHENFDLFVKTNANDDWQHPTIINTATLRGKDVIFLMQKIIKRV
jgi:hypothetical protein